MNKLFKLQNRFSTKAKALSTTSKAFSSLLIKNGTVVNADRKFKADVAIEGGKISGVYLPEQKVHSQKNFTQVIDAQGKYVMPGGIDPHVHLELPFMGTVAVDDFDKGTQAAVAGGTTSFLDFIIPDKNGLIAGYDDWRRRADAKVHCDYSLHCAILDWNKDISQEMEEIVKRGISSFKLFMAYKGTPFYQNDERLLSIFQRCKELGTIAMVHAENGELIAFNQERLVKQGVIGPEGHPLSRTGEIEGEATHRVITIANTVNLPLYIVHVMKKQAADEVVRAKKKGFVVYGEALAAGLGCDGCNYWSKDWDKAAGYVMSPAIDDDPATKEYEMRLLHTHDLDTTATDNCTFTKEQKKMGKDSFTQIPNGCNGIEDRMSVVWNKGVEQGVLTPSDFVRVTSTQTAKIFNMYPRKGVIQSGADADVVIWNPDTTKVISARTHHHAGDFNIFEGMKVKGVAETTISGGRVVYSDGKVHSKPGSGKYIGRENYGFPYERIPALDQVRRIKETPVDRSGKGTDQKSLESRIKELENKLEISESVVNQLNQKLAHANCDKDHNQKQHNHSHSQNVSGVWSQKFKNEINSVEEVLKAYVPEKERDEVLRVIHGSKALDLSIPENAKEIGRKHDFDIVGYKIPALKEELRHPRIVRIGALQNSIKAPTDAPVATQIQAMLDWAREATHAAHLSGVNVLGLQECWNSPFFLCTREKMPWLQFAENWETGPTAQLFKELSAKYNMVIVSPILERDDVKETIHNSAVVFSQGRIMGRHHKNHIPRVGDFNESTYYMEGQLGHPVFETPFGKVGVNICYGRHHPLNWLAQGINGAEIVFNPSATVGGLSEPMWGIEARNAAIANHYFSVAINRVGTERYPNPFTSGDGKPAKNEFGMFYGSSYVAAPDASRTPGLSRTRDGLLVAEVDLNLCRQIKDKWGFTMTNRIEMYAELLTKASKDGYVPQRVK